MKYLIVSDIHGCLPALEQVLQFYHTHHYDMLLILGDILNYGPRNGLPEGLNPKGIAEKLNEMSSDIVAIRGNCDSEVDQMLLNFPILSDYTLVVDEGKSYSSRTVTSTTKNNYPVMDMTPSSTDTLTCGNWRKRDMGLSAIQAPLLSLKEGTLLPLQATNTENRYPPTQWRGIKRTFLLKIHKKAANPM